LLNALVSRDVAIVSDTPGTTRDVLEVRMDLAGLPVCLADTAGLRDAAECADNVEREGIVRARAAASGATLRLCIFDASDDAWPPPPAVLAELSGLLRSGERPSGGEEADAEPPAAPALLVCNKIDRVSDQRRLIERLAHVPEFKRLLDADASAAAGAAAAATDTAVKGRGSLLNIGVPGQRVHFISCCSQSTSGISSLLLAVGDALRPRGLENAVFVRERHLHHARACAAHLHAFLACGNQQLDAAGEELRLAVRELGRLTGSVGVEEVLDSLFANLCIGK
jgi:tRNA modification GTPase